jgi:hypothetical protein
VHGRACVAACFTARRVRGAEFLHAVVRQVLAICVQSKYD